MDVGASGTNSEVIPSVRGTFAVLLFRVNVGVIAPTKTDGFLPCASKDFGCLDLHSEDHFG